MTDYNYHGPVVCFDLDDTLLREKDFVLAAIENTGRKIDAEGIALRSDNESHPWLSGKEAASHMRGIFLNGGNFFDWLEESLCAEYGPEEGKRHFLFLRDSYRATVDHSLKMPEGMSEVLQSLQKRGVVMCIVTDGRSNTQRAKFESLNLQQFIAPHNVFISEEVGADKTTPKSFVEIVRRYPEAKAFFYVGDNERKDFHVPNLLGWTTLRVPYSTDNVWEDYHADDAFWQPSQRMMENTDILQYLP